MALDQVSGDIYEIGGIEGAAFMLNTEGVPSMPMFPFLSSADSSQIITTPYIPDGVTLGPKIETTHGFKWDMSNGHELWVTDALDDPFSAQMPGWDSKGYRILLRMDKGEFPSVDLDDIYRIKKVIFSGDWQSYKFSEQRIEDAAEGSVMPEDIDRSFAIHHKTKCNNRRSVAGVLTDDYKSGKAGQWARPKAYLLDGANIVGVILGFWESINNGDGTLTGVKCWHKADVQSALAIAPAFDTIAVDATLGLSTKGASVFSSSVTGRGVATQPHVATEDGDVTQIYYYTKETDIRHGGNLGVYSGTNRAALVDIPASHKLIGNFDALSAELATFNVDPTFPITNGSTYSFFWRGYGATSGDDDSVYYDVVASGAGLLYSGLTADVFDDPLDASADDMYQITFWLEYTPSGPAPSAVIVKTSGLNLGMGMGM